VDTLPLEAQKTSHIRIVLNGEATDVSFAPYKTLLEVLREDLGHTGTKHGCELGECGACAVLLDGKPVLSCLVLALECSGRNVLTVEGLGTNGNLDMEIRSRSNSAPGTMSPQKYTFEPTGLESLREN